MQCREFEDRLNEVLDERGQPRTDGALLAHAAECEPCGQVLAGHDLVLSTVHRLPTPAPRAGFAQRVVAEAAPSVRLARPTVTSRNWLALGTVLTAAAAALLAVSLVWYARQGTPITANQERANGDGGLVIVERQPSRDRGGSGGSTLALGQSSWIVEAPSLPGRLRQNYRGALDNLAITLPDSVQHLDEVERYAPGIKPLRVSFTVLLNALWRALPGGEDEPEAQPRTTHCWTESAAIA